MTNKYLWLAVIIIGIVSVVAFFNGRTVTQVIQDPLGSSPYMIGPELCVNNLCTYVASGSFKNSTTTIVSFANPYIGSATSTGGQHYAYRATSTIDLVQLYNTGVATSTYTIQCGISNNAGWISKTTQLMIDTGDIATSTNFGLIQSGITNPLGYSILTQYGNKSVASTSLAFGPGQYFVCKANFYADPDEHAKAFVGTGEAFDGNFKVRIIRGY